MKLGVDLSTWDELEALHPTLTYKGKIVEPFSFFSEHSHIKIVRLRIWVDPYDDKGNPYGGGTNDLECTLRLARKAKEAGMAILLDFHYSDFWVDPSRQKLPKSWEGLSFLEIQEKVYSYTKEVLLKMKEEGIEVEATQIGNEITHGMIYPFGQLDLEYSEENGGGFKGFVKLFNQGAKATKEIYHNAKTVLHLEHSGSTDMQQWFLDSVLEEGINFDVVGESYYPYWHGPFKDFKENISNIKNRYHKEVWVVEMGYEFAPFKLEGHHTYFEMVGPEFEVGNIDGRIPFVGTKVGQAEYLKYFMNICYEVGVDAIFYWEPAWVEMPGNGWAKDAGQIYCGLEPVEAFNDWANETLFDFDGVGNDALEIFTQDYADSIK